MLRALHEAGAKVDVVAGRGIGAVSALFAAVDGGARLWDDNGLWRSEGLAQLYRWHPVGRLLAAAWAAAVLIVAVPLGAMALGLIVFPIDFVLKMVGVSGGGLTSWYLAVADAAFQPARLPTWLPRLVVLVLSAAGALALASALTHAVRRRERGPWWWRLVPAPLTRVSMVERCWTVLWDLVRGAAQVRQPESPELARRYAELLADNIGQPGFRELMVTVHDLDTRRDLVCAVVPEGRRREAARRARTADSDSRQSETLDLTGVSRDHLADAIEASLAPPLLTEPRAITFQRDSYWRGETHRLCDRAGSLLRLIEELVGIDVEQIVLVSDTPEIDGP
ncbi:MAG: hypothetical protein AB7O32_07625, partial [Vicinamibacterales bacterium]